MDSFGGVRREIPRYLVRHETDAARSVSWMKVQWYLFVLSNQYDGAMLNGLHWKWKEWHIIRALLV